MLERSPPPSFSSSAPRCLLPPKMKSRNPINHCILLVLKSFISCFHSFYTHTHGRARVISVTLSLASHHFSNLVSTLLSQLVMLQIRLPVTHPLRVCVFVFAKLTAHKNVRVLATYIGIAATDKRMSKSQFAEHEQKNVCNDALCDFHFSLFALHFHVSRNMYVPFRASILLVASVSHGMLCTPPIFCYYRVWVLVYVCSTNRMSLST